MQLAFRYCSVLAIVVQLLMFLIFFNQLWVNQHSALRFVKRMTGETLDYRYGCVHLEVILLGLTATFNGYFKKMTT